MAKLIPTRNSCLPRMTSGEKRLSERLEEKLEDDYLCWYDVPVGPKQLRPDFVVVHPARGLLVLEVKDWRIDSIQTIDRSSVALLTERGLAREKNPLLQARVYALELVTALQKDEALRAPRGHSHFGKLLMPFGFGAVLTNITRQQFEAAELGEVLDPDSVLCKDEMSESVDTEAFQKRLWQMFRVVFPCALTLPQLDRIRWHLFPEIRVTAKAGQIGLFGADDSQAAIPDIVKVMDLQQEQLARSLGEGHRVVHGVAGSGKTMILGYRSLYLAQVLTKPILVLCYNVTLAARLRELIESRDIQHRIAVRSFHAWCREMLVAYHVDLPPKGDEFFDQMVEKVIAGVSRGQIPRAQYGAVLIDEGHDFEPDWFRLVVQMVDPATDALLVLYDDAQTIYGRDRKARGKFSFASVGVQAKGRTTILKLNYRNTVEVLSVARAFGKELLTQKEAEDDGVPMIAPESGGRRGAVPELIRCESEYDEATLIAARINEEHSQGRPLSEMAVIYRSESGVAGIEAALTRNGIAYSKAKDNKRALFDGAPSVKLVTMHSSKGLEFSTVFVPGLGAMPDAKFEETEEARLLYVAMTRATERLVMTHIRESLFSGRIRTAINDVQGTLAAAHDQAS